MNTQHHITVSDTLYRQLQTLAASKGQTVDAFVQESLGETVEEIDDSTPLTLSLLALPDPEQVLPPYGSEAELALRQELATALSQGPALSQIIIEDRGER
jgi:hypothetical protein